MFQGLVNFASRDAKQGKNSFVMSEMDSYYQLYLEVFFFFRIFLSKEKYFSSGFLVFSQQVQLINISTPILVILSQNSFFFNEHFFYARFPFM